MSQDNGQVFQTQLTAHWLILSSILVLFLAIVLLMISTNVSIYIAFAIVVIAFVRLFFVYRKHAFPEFSQLFYNNGKWQLLREDELVEVELDTVSQVFEMGFSLSFRTVGNKDKPVIQVWKESCNPAFYRFVSQIYQFGSPE